MNKILILGNKGMLGHVVERYLKETGKYWVIGSNREDFDVIKEDPRELIKKHNPDFIINCIGILNNSKDVEAMKKVNTLFPHKLAELSRDHNFRCIHISTDCVFNGTEGYPYSEESFPCPKDFYGASKAAGEIVDNHNLTIRTSIIGPELKENGIGLFKWVCDNKGKEVNGFCNAIWSGVTTFELAKAIDYFIENKTIGLINFTLGKISKRDLIILINKIYDLGMTINDNMDFVEKRVLTSNREEMTQYPKKSFLEMIQEMKGWY
ncbi:dTDP-4-dehydrorhamnose reductase family protein [Nanoarchaeota archaeon]